MGLYRTIFTGTLVQDSALSLGGNQPHAAVDDPMCKDGMGRYTIRGTTLAGALLTTAAKIFGRVSATISNKYANEPEPPTQAGSAERNESLWRVFNAHPKAPASSEDPRTELRQGVKIFTETGAAEETALFDAETLPRGTRWSFCMEINTFEECEHEYKDCTDAEAVAVKALQERKGGRCWLGRSVARGMGWMHLTDLRGFRLTTEHIDLWPDSSRELEETLASLKGMEIPFDSLGACAHRLPLEAPWYYVEIPCSVSVGQRDLQAYGLDALAVGGHAAAGLALKWREESYLAIPGMKSETQDKGFQPDLGMAMCSPPRAAGKHSQDNGGEPFVPGSSIRGTMRHALERLRNIDSSLSGSPAAESVDGETTSESSATCDVERLFGTMKRSADLLVQDAYLPDDGAWTAMWLHNHAEDEFVGGVYRASKHDRVALVQGEFHFKLVIESKTAKEAEDAFRLLDKVLNLARQGRLPLGGGQWRGLGWPSWNIGSARLFQAGSFDEIRCLDSEQ